jgi:quinol-cytochrome oxidoreductase complex cytochrome b subunit
MTIRNQRFSLLKQPISSTLKQHLVDYPTPSNLSYWWGFGPLAGTMILSVLSSLALVSGLMVVRAKNPVC